MKELRNTDTRQLWLAVIEGGNGKHMSPEVNLFGVGGMRPSSQSTEDEAFYFVKYEIKPWVGEALYPLYVTFASLRLSVQTK